MYIPAVMHVRVWGTGLRSGHKAIHWTLTHPVLGVNQGGRVLGGQHALRAHLRAHHLGSHALRSWPIAQQPC